MKTFQRRSVLQLALVGVFSLSTPAWAGSYLDRAGLLVAEAERASEFLRRRPHDRELARVIHRLSESRLRAASTMQVPQEIAQAHPHLLLVLENHERAAFSAREGQAKDLLKFLRAAREEEQLLRGVLRQLGWELPRAD